MIRGINSLGIAKSHKCPNCSKVERLNEEERHDIAECILNNGAGMFALLHCGHCGWVDKIYPTRINGIKCTPKECDELLSEIRQFEKGEKNDSKRNV